MSSTTTTIPPTTSSASGDAAAQNQTAAASTISDADKVKKDIENEIHPAVKTLWEKFEGDIEKAKAWLESRI